MPGEPRSILILGGARSGKSRYAIEQAVAIGGRAAFVATAEALDAAMMKRITRHRQERPAHWVTVEAPIDLVSAVQDLTGYVDTLIIDCLTIWVANRCQREVSNDALLADADALADLVKARRVTMLLVSNEVGQGVHPETELGLRFRDLLGVVNQRVAAAADQVILMVAGLPLTVKEVSRGSTQSLP